METKEVKVPIAEGTTWMVLRAESRESQALVEAAAKDLSDHPPGPGLVTVVVPRDVEVSIHETASGQDVRDLTACLIRVMVVLDAMVPRGVVDERITGAVFDAWRSVRAVQGRHAWDPEQLWPFGDRWKP